MRARRELDPRARRAVDTAVIAGLLVSFPARAPAQPPEPMEPGPMGNDLAADAIAAAPFGDWADRTGVGVGAGVRLRVPLTGYTAITARLAAVWHTSHDTPAPDALTVGLVELPWLGGVRSYVSAPARVRGFLAGEAGIVVRRTSIASGGAVDADWTIGFASSLGGGVELGAIELEASVWLADLAHVDHAAGAMITAGATFAAW